MNEFSADVGLQEAHDHALQSCSPLPRRKLSFGILVLLWLLRIYVVLAVPLVVYSFFRSLRLGQ